MKTATKNARKATTRKTVKHTRRAPRPNTTKIPKVDPKLAAEISEFENEAAQGGADDTDAQDGIGDSDDLNDDNDDASDETFEEQNDPGPMTADQVPSDTVPRDPAIGDD